MKTFIERLEKRELDIKNWLQQNNLEFFLAKADEILASLPKETIQAEFKEQMQIALEHCVKNEEIKSLDFQWYYGGDVVDDAYAYGFEESDDKAALSATDLGPNELSGIEIEIEQGSLVDQEFASLPVYHAIDAMVEKIIPLIEEYEENNELHWEAETVITDYFQIWNYKIASIVCEALKDDVSVQKLKARSPFLVTMTRHERWSVAIMLLS